ncbi:MAG TPA: gas vesicle protein GvpG [Conexibacter sp.]|nr:gas vesicle protein GvpG [Conexibacter sp.]
MGLIKELVLLPVAPVRFTAWIAEQVHEETRRSQTSPGAVVQQLDALEEAREQGKLSPEEAERRQGEVIEQATQEGTQDG